MMQIRVVMEDDPEKLLHEPDHPGAQRQVEFWRLKAACLNNICEQLESAKVRSIINILNLSKSSYAPAFDKLCEEVSLSRAEANSNQLSLTVLDRLFGQMDPNAGPDYKGIAELFRPIMHGLKLVWMHSSHFNTMPRLVVLFRMLGNDLIKNGMANAEGEKIFEMDPPDAVEKIKTTIEVCVQLQREYLDAKALVASECKKNPWKVQSTALFGRVDSFVERCTDVQDVIETVHQFNRLEKIEIGGTKGRTLTGSVIQVYDDFNPNPNPNPNWMSSRSMMTSKRLSASLLGYHTTYLT